MHRDYRRTPAFIEPLASEDYRHMLASGSIIREFPEPDLAEPWRKAIRAKARADRQRVQTHVLRGMRERSRHVVAAWLPNFTLSDEEMRDAMRRALGDEGEDQE